MWRLSVPDCYIHLRHWHANDIDRFYACHDYPIHFDVYVHIVIYSVCLSVDSPARISS